MSSKIWIVSRFGMKIREEKVPCEYSKEEALAYLIDQEGYSEDITIEEANHVA